MHYSSYLKEIWSVDIFLEMTSNLIGGRGGRSPLQIKGLVIPKNNFWYVAGNQK